MRPSHRISEDIAGFVMAQRPSNLACDEWGIALLHLPPSDRVVEIGFVHATATPPAMSRHIVLRIPRTVYG